jgi:hypothetical protein
MAKITAMSAFLKVDPSKRWGDATSPVESPEEEAAHNVQCLVRSVSLARKPLTAAEFLDLSHDIGTLARAPNGITMRLARELVDVLVGDWTRRRAVRYGRA